MHQARSVMSKNALSKMSYTERSCGWRERGHLAREKKYAPVTNHWIKRATSDDTRLSLKRYSIRRIWIRIRWNSRNTFGECISRVHSLPQGVATRPVLILLSPVLLCVVTDGY